MQKRPTQPDWDDLRLILAVARAGGLGGAAAALGVDHSTVFRRLNAVEQLTGTKLFLRRPSGYVPTEAGERVLASAERMEAEALAVERELTGRDARLEGRLRVTSSETLAHGILTDEIARFRRSHPGIVVELVIDNRSLDLSRREADLALRATRPQEPDLFGRKLADIDWAVYGSRRMTFSERSGAGPAALVAKGPTIGWGLGAPPLRAAEWIAGSAPGSAIVYRSNSLTNQLVAAKAGIGLAVLPCYLAGAEPELRRLGKPLPELTRELWMVTHRDLKDTARVRAFMDAAGEGIARRVLGKADRRSIPFARPGR